MISVSTLVKKLTKSVRQLLGVRQNRFHQLMKRFLPIMQCYELQNNIHFFLYIIYEIDIH